MSESRSAGAIEFVRLNGQAIRVTSWRAGAGQGPYTLVTISRGSRDASLLDELLSQGQLQLEVGSDRPVTVRVGEIDRRTVGEGESGITRFSVVLTEGASDGRADDGDGEPAPALPSVDDRVAALEAEVARLRALIDAHVNGVRH